MIHEDDDEDGPILYRDDDDEIEDEGKQKISVTRWIFQIAPRLFSIPDSFTFKSLP